MILANLDVLYGKEEANRIYDRIFSNIYKKDYEKFYKELNDLISEYEFLCNQFENKKENFNDDYRRVVNDWLLYRNILYRLNRKEFISQKQIDKIKQLFEKNDIKKEHAIIMSELINHHNIRCSFNNPITSYTTIKIVGSDFEDLEQDEFLDKDTKLRLDKFADSLFEEFTKEDKIKNPNEYLDEFTSWMSDADIEYVLKGTLNNFLMLLRELKNDMLTGTNYENVEERKRIISMYNFYYYEYKKVLDYYYQKFKKEEEVIELEEDLSIKNNIFFLMSTNGSHFEKDLSDVPKEYYEKVKFLLSGFKFQSDFSKYIKQLSANSHLKGYLELRLDQIRIIYRHLSDNNYLFLGVFVKKEDTGRRLYTNVVNRDCNYDISTEDKFTAKYNESEDCYDIVMQILDENKRKGNR